MDEILQIVMMDLCVLIIEQSLVFMIYKYVKKLMLMCVLCELVVLLVKSGIVIQILV